MSANTEKVYLLYFRKANDEFINENYHKAVEVFSLSCCFFLF